MEVDCEGCASCCIDWRPLTGRLTGAAAVVGERAPAPPESTTAEDDDGAPPTPGW